MSALPLVAHFRGDILAQLMPVDTDDTMDVVAEKVTYHSIGLRLKPRDAAKQVIYNGQVLPQNTTVADAGMGPMDYIEVRYVTEQ
jgi:toluene monooxygenase system protein B